MCLQCETKSIVIGNIGDISIQISTQDHPEWKEGAIGLVFLNDPFVVFNEIKEWSKDSYFDLSDDEIEKILEFTSDEKHWDAVELVNQIKFDPYDGYKFILNLKALGYDEEEHGYRWASYFVHKIAEMLEMYENN